MRAGYRLAGGAVYRGRNVLDERWQVKELHGLRHFHIFDRTLLKIHFHD